MSDAKLKTILMELVDARTVMLGTSSKVQAWMVDRARAGTLCIANQCPSWPEHDAAVRRFDAALAQLDVHLATFAEVGGTVR